ncbi:MAG: SDR family NAD(P)-dependent oxidoreductase [Bermanella sp.]
MNSIVIGANSAIATTIINQLAPSCDNIIAVSRKAFSSNHDNIKSVVCDYTETSISNAAQQINQFHLPSIDRIYICNGILHSESLKVEKRIEDIDPNTFSSVINANTLTPILWLQALFPLIQKQQCKVIVFSARVGSISDNRLGGWYSYRASKAALNMLLKNASLEFAKRAKGIKILAFHPGTTDTNLSKPFQKNVAKGKLFTPEFVAQQLETIVNQIQADGRLSYLDWQGKEMSW